MAGEVLRVKNVGNTTFVGKGDGGTIYRIPAGGEAIVPREATWYWLGRPWLVNKDHHKDRQVEYQRLLNRYGSAFSDGRDEVPEPLTAEEKWERNRPRLEVYSLDNERVWTVVDDPEGRHVTQAEETVAERDLLADTVEKLRRELAAMQGRLNSIDRGEAMPNLEEIESDEPTKIPTGPRRGREVR